MDALAKRYRVSDGRTAEEGSERARDSSEEFRPQGPRDLAVAGGDDCSAGSAPSS